jgi:hypothetical protein
MFLNKSKIKLEEYFMCIFIMILLGFSLLYSNDLKNSGNIAFDKNKYAAININNWSYWVSNERASLTNPHSTESAVFPQKTTGVLYCDGFFWAGFINSTHIPENLRSGGSYYRSGMQMGWITRAGNQTDPPKALPSNDPRARFYRVRGDLFTLQQHEIVEDAATYFNVDINEVTEDQVTELKKQYYNDWLEWPAEFGAPFYDRNRNGKWDSDYDEPGIAGADQTIWYVVNDLDTSKCDSLLGSMPIGLELQVTIWAYKYKANVIGNSIFKRYRLINKSANTIDSMYIGQFADIDIGNPGNDFSGCDSVLNMGYIYNSNKFDEPYSTIDIIPPPAVGYILLQGPVTEAQGEQAYFDFKLKMNYINLPMIAFWYKATGMPYTDPAPGGYFGGTIQAYNMLRGYVPDYDFYNPTPYYHRSGNNFSKPTKFPVNGNPVTGTGDIDGEGDNLSAGDRRFVISSGPFTMAPGDTQDIALAIVGALGPHDSSNVSSVARLQEYAPLLHTLWQSFNDFESPEGPVPGRETFNISEFSEYPVFILGQNYPNPFNNTTRVRFKLLGEMDIRLSIYNINGQLIKNLFEGLLIKDEYIYDWDGRDNNGQLLPSGIYFIRMQSGAKFQCKKLILIK